jgi:hypothetical protein
MNFSIKQHKSILRNIGFLYLSAYQLIHYFYKMPVQQTIPFEEGTFFITFTCHKWMNLIETTDSYDLV